MRKAGWKGTGSLGEVQERKEGRQYCRARTGEESTIFSQPFGQVLRYSHGSLWGRGDKQAWALPPFSVREHEQAAPPARSWLCPSFTDYLTRDFKTQDTTTNIHVCNSFCINKFYRRSFCSKPMDSASTVFKCSLFSLKGPLQHSALILFFLLFLYSHLLLHQRTDDAS